MEFLRKLEKASMTEHEQKWREVKARLDALDDGRGLVSSNWPTPIWGKVSAWRAWTETY